MKNLILIFTLLLFIFPFNCSTEPEDKSNEGLKLIIQNGYYTEVSRADTQIECSIDFDYGVIGDTCYIGGYGIDWGDERGGSVNWYLKQKLEPGIIYSIHNTFNLDRVVSKGPLIGMQGYLKGSSESDSRLKVEYQLKKK
jgi:hypothetical protein